MEDRACTIGQGPRPVLYGHANRWYLPAVSAIKQTGVEVTARGRRTWEVLHALTVLPDPRKRVLTIPYRRANPFFQAAEALWLLAGRADAAWILQYNSQLGKYLDEYADRLGWVSIRQKAAHFHGAYGERLRQYGRHAVHIIDPGISPDELAARTLRTIDQLWEVVDQLRQDPGSRRAVATIHDPVYDNVYLDTLDRPCNLALTYQLRDNKLWAATCNRSNDLNLGLAYTNIVQFTTVQEFLAQILGADVGEYSHFSSSLHVYEDDPIVQRLVAHEQTVLFDVYDHVTPTPMAVGHRNPVDAFRFVEALANRAWSSTSSEAVCPYWRSVARMLEVWDVLYAPSDQQRVEARLADAFYGLCGMPAADWRIACLEYLHRWACRRGVQTVFWSHLSQFLEPGHPLHQYITHDNATD